MARAQSQSRWAGVRVWDVPADTVSLRGARRAILRLGPESSVAEAIGSGAAREGIIGLAADLACLPQVAAQELPLTLVPGLVRILWDGSDPRERVGRLRQVGACLDLPPLAGALEALVQYSEGGIMCRLADPNGWTADAAGLAATLEHYLTSPRLEVPVEPWHSIARGVASRRPSDLSGTYDETLRRNYWLGEDGAVSLSERQAAQGMVFGRLEDGPERWQQSPAWRALEDRRRRPFLARTRCAFCPHYPWCGGYAAGEDGHPDPAWCEVWIPLYDRILETADLARAQAAEAEGEEYPG